MTKYNPKKIEAKWQKVWEQKKVHQAKDPSASSGQATKPKWYSLFEFPYPSGDGLHVGHLRPYVGLDIITRKVIATVPTGAGPNGVSFSPLVPAVAPSPTIPISMPGM
jgi:isoleucyl-tRNA synthetase